MIKHFKDSFGAEGCKVLKHLVGYQVGGTTFTFFEMPDSLEQFRVCDGVIE